jgi:fatty acid desaturase
MEKPDCGPPHFGEPSGMTQPGEPVMSTQPTVQQRTIVTDIEIPFGRMVVFLIKLGLAAIPALIILWLITALLMATFGMLFGFGWWMHRPV